MTHALQANVTREDLKTSARCRAVFDALVDEPGDELGDEPGSL